MLANAFFTRSIEATNCSSVDPNLQRACFEEDRKRSTSAPFSEQPRPLNQLEQVPKRDHLFSQCCFLRYQIKQYASASQLAVRECIFELLGLHWSEHAVTSGHCGSIETLNTYRKSVSKCGRTCDHSMQTHDRYQRQNMILEFCSSLQSEHEVVNGHYGSIETHNTYRKSLSERDSTCNCLISLLVTKTLFFQFFRNRKISKTERRWRATTSPFVSDRLRPLP